MSIALSHHSRTGKLSGVILNVLLAGVFPLVSGQSRASDSLRVRWIDFGQFYCAGAEDLGLARIIVRGSVVFENRGRQTLVLWRGPHSHGAIRLKPAIPTTPGTSDEVVIHPPLRVGSTDRATGKTTAEDFIELKPNKVFKEPFQFGFPVPTATNHYPTIQPTDGEYLASVEVSLLDETRVAQPTALGRGGRVLDGFVWIEPITVKVDSRATSEPCTDLNQPRPAR